MSRIVVLGGAGIIGQAIAQDMADDVAEVVIADLNLAAAEEVAHQLGKGCVAERVDVTQPEQLCRILLRVCSNS